MVLLQAEVKEHIEAGAALCADVPASYSGLGRDFAHQVVEHRCRGRMGHLASL